MLSACRSCLANQFVNLTSQTKQLFSTSPCLQELILLSRVRVIDNSPQAKASANTGKPAKIIHVYKKSHIAKIGDKVLVAVNGEKKKAYVVGCRQKQKANVPRFDTNNVVLIEDNGTPVGTRIKHPIPSCLRGKEDFTKIISIATRFV